MIHASELTPPAKRVPYWKARLAELIAQGKAERRVPGQRDSQSSRKHRLATRLSWVFASRLAVMLEARVYYSAANRTLAFRRQFPRPALNGKVYIPKLPADAVFVGRYAYPFPRRTFLRDLIEVIGGAT